MSVPSTTTLSGGVISSVSSAKHKITASPLGTIKTVSFSDGGIIVSLSRVPVSSSDAGATHILTEEEKAAQALSVQKSKTRGRIRAYGYANQFEYFATFTFSDEFCADVENIKNFSKFLANFRSNHIKDPSYQDFCMLWVLVPAFGDGKSLHYHVHALMSGLPNREVYALTDEHPHSKSQGNAMHSGVTLFHWKSYDKFLKRFGPRGFFYDLRRIGMPDGKGEEIQQSGKVEYLARQFNGMDADLLHSVSRRVHKVGKLKKSPKSQLAFADQDMLVKLVQSYGITTGVFGGSGYIPPEEAAAFMTHLAKLPNYIESLSTASPIEPPSA